VNDLLKHTRRIFFPNGLTLLLHPLENSEAAALHFCVKAGYFCEQDPEVGLAHLLEHMYFKGSANFPEPGALGIRMKALGGMINASTSYDQTNYFCEVPAENLSAAIEIMGDAFAAPVFPADELTRETEVVIEEFNRKLDNPSAYSLELLIRLAFTQHRMKRWRIGTPRQLRSYTRDHLFDYFHRYYQPQNMIVTVTGKFDEENTRESLERVLSPMSDRELTKDFGPEEPPQTGLRYAFGKAAATQSYLHLGFHAPGVMHPDGPALEVLAFLLASGRSARLHRHLVERKRSASFATCYYLAYENVGLITSTAITEAGKIREAGSDIWNVIQDLCENGVGADELQKVKNKLRLHQAMQTEDALSLAELLSYYEAYGSYERIAEHLERMQALTGQEIQAAAQKYCGMDNLSVMEFVNQDINESSADQYRTHLQTGFVSPQAGLSFPFLPAEPDGTGHAQTWKQPLIQKGGKVTTIFHPDESYPFIAAGIFFQGGRNEESEMTAGLTHFLFRNALKGTSKLSAEQLAFQFDALGNPPRFSCFRDFSGFVMEAMPESFTDMWNLLLHCLTDAQFPPEEIETEKGKVLAVIQRNMDDNYIRPLQLFQKAFYGSHPYGIPESGYESSVAAFHRDSLLEWKKRLFNASRCVVVVVGSFDPDRILPILEQSMASFESNGEPIKEPGSMRGPTGRNEIEQREKKQTAFVLGFPGVAAGSPDTHHYDAMQQILAGMGGRLFLNVRSKKSLAYTVHASAVSSLYGGTFQTYIAGEAAKEEQALEAIWHELEKIQESSVSKDELDNAKNSLIGSYTLNTQTASSKILDYVNCFLLGRPLPYAPVYRELIRTVTPELLMETARRTFVKENSTMGIVRGTTEITEAEKLISASK